jgi:hypothetical protein
LLQSEHHRSKDGHRVRDKTGERPTRSRREATLKLPLPISHHKLARAESELEAAQRFVDPGGGGEAELALARTLANARASVADAMETVRMTLGEQDAREDDGPLL